MAVKRSQSASRVLVVLEAVAAHQPIGVSVLARQLGIDKSAAQRALMTLADDGWIRAAPGGTALWELTPRVLTLAHPPYSVESFRRRARDVLESLRIDTGETVFLTVPDVRRFVIVDALESPQMVRMVPPIGMIAPPRESATGRVVLPYLPVERQTEFLGRAPDAAMLAEFAATRARGYAICDGDIDVVSMSVAAAVFGGDGQPVGAIVVAGPRDRIAEEEQNRIGSLLVRAAASVSTGLPAGTG